jgi:aminoglycoside 6'-N-acetyltransferase
MSYPILTDRLSIEPLSLEDIDSFVSYRQDPDIARYQGWEPTYSKEQALDLLKSQEGLSRPGKDDWLQLAVHNRVSGVLVGDLALHRLPDDETIYELGFTIAKSYQGQGLAREATSKLMGYLISEGATGFIATTDSRNLASINVLIALGFQRQPSKSWTEKFKNEIVTVDYFEAS